VTHRAGQIVDAIAELLAARVSSTIKVFKHRRLSLADDQGELPAISVDFGEDQPAGDQPLRGINSVLNVVITGVAVAPTEDELREKLLVMREASDDLMDEHMHQIQPRLGLTFVYGIGYGGAAAPDINADDESIVGSLASNWNVGYRMR
jgi:hypothetical protein